MSESRTFSLINNNGSDQWRTINEELIIPVSNDDESSVIVFDIISIKIVHAELGKFKFTLTIGDNDEYPFTIGRSLEENSYALSGFHKITIQPKSTKEFKIIMESQSRIYPTGNIVITTTH